MAQIFIFRCVVEYYYLTDTGSVYTSEKETESFNNELKFIGLRPCEGDIVVVFVRAKEKKKCSKFYPKYFNLDKYHLTIMLINKS